MARKELAEGVLKGAGEIKQGVVDLKDRITQALKPVADEANAIEDGFDDIDQSAGARLERGATGVSPDGVPLKGLKGYHSSPHDFDEFDISKIGTGEGSQIYGHGLYMAEEPKVMGTYHKKFQGQRYEVDIDATPEQLLDWDAPIESQSPQIQESVEQLLRESVDDPDGVAVMGFDGTIIDRAADHSPEEWAVMLKAYERQGNKVSTNLELERQRVGSGAGYHEYLAEKYGGQENLAKALLAKGVKGVRYLDGLSRNKPFNEIKKEFLEALPEDAGFDELADLMGTGQFNAPQERVLRALEADDWLGFDYPSQAINAAFKDLGNYDASPELVKAVSDLAEGGTRNMVIFDDKLLRVTKKFGVAMPVAGIIALSLTPEEAEAGLYDGAARLFDNKVGAPNAPEISDRAVTRGRRPKAERTMAVSNDEKMALRDDLKTAKKGTFKDAQAAARNFKNRHPTSGVEQPWEPVKILGIDVSKDRKGKLVYKPKLQKVPYNFHKIPSSGKVAGKKSQHYQKVRNGVVTEIIEIAERAKAGDPAAMRIMENQGWYKNVESRGFNEYGSFFDTFGDLLGATSPNTDVKSNFQFSRDVLERLHSGELDVKINHFARTLDQIDLLEKEIANAQKIFSDKRKAKQPGGKTADQYHKTIQYQQKQAEIKRLKKLLDNDPVLQREREDITFTRGGKIKIESAGKDKQYGMNSDGVMLALADRWRIWKKGDKPKAKNFSGNLVGYSDKATIDVWAARNLRRHAGLRPIPSAAENGVTGSIVDPIEFTNSQEFGWAQDLLEDATERLNQALGKDWTPRDVQALQWFAEKEVWSKNGWTNAAGEGGSFISAMNRNPTSSWTIGTSSTMTDEMQGLTKIPTAAEQAEAQGKVLDKMADDPDVIAGKAKSTVGRYFGADELSHDVEMVTNQYQISTQALDQVAIQAVKDEQDSFFVARRIPDEIGSANPEAFTVGTEVYFHEAVSGDSLMVRQLMRRLNKNNVPGFTMIIDPRPPSKRTTPLPEEQGVMVQGTQDMGELPDGIIGVRYLDIPQYQDPERFAKMSDAEYRFYVRDKAYEYNRIAAEISESNELIRSAEPAFFDVNVKPKRAAEEYVAQLQSGTRDPDVLHSDFWGFKPATTRFREFSGKVGPYYRSGGEGTSFAKFRGTSLVPAATVAGVTIAAAAPTFADDLEGNLERSSMRDATGVDEEYMARMESMSAERESAQGEQTGQGVAGVAGVAVADGADGEEPGMLAGAWDKATDPAYMAQAAVEVVPQLIAGVGNAVSEFNDTLNDVEAGSLEMVGVDMNDPETRKMLAMGGVDPEQRFQPLEGLAALADTYQDAIGEAATGPGAAANLVGQVMVPMFATAGWLKGLGFVGGKTVDAARMLTAETIVGATMMDPFEDGFFKMLEGWGVTEDLSLWLQEKDSEAEGRVKNAIDVALAGTAFEATLAGLTPPAKWAAKQMAKIMKSPAGMKIMALTGSLFLARKATKRGLDPGDEAQQIMELEARRMQELLDKTGDPSQPVYNHGAKSIDEVEINFGRIESEQDLEDLMQTLADSDIDEIDKARRGVVSHAQTEMEAGMVNAWEKLASLRPEDATPLNAAESLAIRKVWVQSSERAHALAEQIAVDPSPANHVAYKRQLVLHHAIQRKVLAVRAETARALNAWAIPANTADLQKIFDQLSNEVDIEKVAKMHLALKAGGLDDMADEFVYGTAWAKGRDAVASVWYFSLLSGFKTHARNAIGNSLVALMHPVEREMAAGIGRLRGEQNIEQGEGMQYLYGMLKGTWRALRVSRETERVGTVWQSIATGESGFGIGKVDLPMQSGFHPEKLQIGPDHFMYYPAKWADGLVSTAGRALSAADELFKTAAYDGEIQALAWREAHQRVRAGDITEDQFLETIENMVSDPGEYTKLQARARAQRATFTDTPERTEFYKAWESMARVPILGKLVLPFRKTPYNIGLFTFERTPLAPFVKRYRDAIAEGGAKADMAQAQWVMGNTLLLIGADMALNGTITGGGPVDMSEREAWMQEHAPYSFEWQDENGVTQSRSFQGMEPISSFLSLSAATVDILKTQDWDNPNKDVTELALAATIAIADMATNQQYMRGLSDFITMMDDPQRNADYYFNRLGGMAVPTGVAQFARADDPVVRHVGSMIDALKSRTPGLSKSLPATFDRWGRERSRESGLGPWYDGMSPFYARQIKPEPIDLELRRLNKHVGKPGPNQTFEQSVHGEDGPGITVNLKKRFPHAYWRLVELRGNGITAGKFGEPIQASGYVSSGGTLREELNMIAEGTHPTVAAEFYNNILTDGEDGGKARFLQNIVSAFNKAARDQLLTEFPDLRAEVMARNSTPQYKFQESR